MKTSLHRRELNGTWDTALATELDSPRSLVLAFSSPALFDNPEPFEEVLRAFPSSAVVGCSTSGEIFGDQLLDDSLCVAVARFDSTEVRSHSVTIDTPHDSHVIGRRLAESLLEDSLSAIFVISDGLRVNGTELIKGLTSVLPEKVIVTGGLAGDGKDFERTWILDSTGLCENKVVAVGFYGNNLVVGHGSRGGWDQFGIEREVTRSEGNVLFELDGRPALELYREYLGERADGLPATGLLFPLSIRQKDDNSDSLVRTILSISDEERSMTFAGDIPQGCRAKLMRCTPDRLVEGAAQAAEAARDSISALISNQEVLSIAISCVGRRLVLGETAEEELEAILSILPSTTKQIGFYSYGEISPNFSGVCDLHNQTMTLTTFSEKADPQ
ncbi:MAG: FIST C-terminal domain-containing protein [Bdellovibrionales bacterium]|nr:FIST C-terminal domain-containing protein [Bdellovibrionales bacterium]